MKAVTCFILFFFTVLSHGGILISLVLTMTLSFLFLYHCPWAQGALSISSAFVNTVCAHDLYFVRELNFALVYSTRFMNNVSHVVNVRFIHCLFALLPFCL